MRTILIGVLLASAAWGQDDLDARVRGLVAKLSDDSVETREDAAAGLVALGEPALGPLRQALLRTANDEVRGRIQGALDRISADARRRNFKGGTPVGGLAVSLEATREKGSDEFVLKIQIMNVGSQAKSLVPVQRWSTNFPDHGSSSSASEAAVDIVQLTGEQSTSKSFTIG